MAQISAVIQQQYLADMKQAITNKDASRLDLILRSKHLLENSGKSVNTVKMEFSEVKSLQPNFYKVIKNM